MIPIADMPIAGMQGRTAPEILRWSKEIVDPGLRAAVGTLPRSIRRIAGYHFGWWDEHGRPTQHSSGKTIRPTLVLLAAAATGGMPAEALPGAVAVELVHNFSLLHDDIMDRDQTRRHRPTAWKVFGTSAAILAGDSLLTLAFDMLAAARQPAGTETALLLSSAVQELIEGQSLDLGMEQRTEVTMAECLEMSMAKTAALLRCACAIGAQFGGGDPGRVADLSAFGGYLGLAFQHVDDLLGIWGDPAVTGKPVHSDLHSRKKSLPVVSALTSGTAAAYELGVLLRSPGELSPSDVARAASLISEAGARDWCQSQVESLLGQAERHLQAAVPDGPARAELAALADLATNRDH